eukprot:7392000-Prymnesium_polylepis.2
MQAAPPPPAHSPVHPLTHPPQVCILEGKPVANATFVRAVQDNPAVEYAAAYDRIFALGVRTADQAERDWLRTQFWAYAVGTRTVAVGFTSFEAAVAGAKWHSDERPNAAAVKKLADCAEKAIAKKVAAETAEKAARVVEEVAANADVSDVSDEEDSMPLDLRQKLRGVAPEGGGTKRRRAPAAAAKRAFFIGTQRVELFMAKDLVGLGKETARKFVYLPEASAAVVQGDRVSLPDGAITTTMKIPRNDRKAIFIGTQRVELFTAEELVGLREETAKFVFVYVPTELGVQEPFKAGETSELEKLCCRTLRDMNRQSRAERRLPAAPVVEEPDGVTGLSHAQMEQLGCPSVVNGSTAGQCAIYAFSRLLSQRSCGPTECAEQVAALKAEAAQQPRKWITTAAFESGDAAFSQAEINYASQEGAQVQLGMLHLALAKAGISCLLL